MEKYEKRFIWDLSLYNGAEDIVRQMDFAHFISSQCPDYAFQRTPKVAAGHDAGDLIKTASYDGRKRPDYS